MLSIQEDDEPYIKMSFKVNDQVINISVIFIFSLTINNVGKNVYLWVDVLFVTSK